MVSCLILMFSFVTRRTFSRKSFVSIVQYHSGAFSPPTLLRRSAAPTLRSANSTLHTVGKHYATLLHVLPAEESWKPFQYDSHWWEKFEKKRKDVLSQYDW